MSEEKEFELRPNGKVWFKVDKEEHLCRRPTVGELRKILELRAEVAEKDGAAIKTKPSAAVHSVTQAKLVVEWVHDALGMLTDKPMPAVDDLPGWATSTALLDKLITHWQSVPLVPSGA